MKKKTARVRVQVIKVYQLEIEVDADMSNSDIEEKVYNMQSTQIADEGKLMDVTVDHAEVVD